MQDSTDKEGSKEHSTPKEELAHFSEPVKLKLRQNHPVGLEA